MKQAEIVSNIAHNLRLLRGEEKEPARVTATCIGIPEKKYSSYESGRALPKKEVILRICEMYGVGLEKFITTRFKAIEDEIERN